MWERILAQVFSLMKKMVPHDLIRVQITKISVYFFYPLSEPLSFFFFTRRDPTPHTPRCKRLHLRQGTQVHAGARRCAHRLMSIMSMFSGGEARGALPLQVRVVLLCHLQDLWDCDGQAHLQVSSKWFAPLLLESKHLHANVGVIRWSSKLLPDALGQLPPKRRYFWDTWVSKNDLVKLPTFQGQFISFTVFRSWL